MPAGGDLRQYNGRRDWGTQRDAQRAMYDLCRDSGMGHDQASLHSELGSEQLARSQGDMRPLEGAVRGGLAAPAPRRRGRAQFKTPWWGPHAGKLCEVLPDGTLEPLEDGGP